MDGTMSAPPLPHYPLQSDQRTRMAQDIPVPRRESRPPRQWYDEPKLTIGDQGEPPRWPTLPVE